MTKLTNESLLIKVLKKGCVMKKSLFSILVLALVVVGCGKSKTNVSQATTTPGGDLVIATINGENITEADIKSLVADQMQKVEMELYEIRKDGIDRILEQRLIDMEAKKRNVTPENLIQTEVQDKVKVDDALVKQFYEQRKDSFKEKEFKDVEQNIRAYLANSETQKLKGGFIAQLKKEAQVKLLIQPPRFEVGVDDDPCIGPKGAPVTVIEFTDYQCPFCGRVRPTINQIIEEYKEKVQYCLRDFPLAFHQDAPKAHEAAECAGDQDKYWEYNKVLFNNQGAIKVDDLKSYAKRVSLDTKKFDKCLDSGKYKDEVMADQRDGQKYGVSGTPSFFINGRSVSGARPFEAFKVIIDDELERSN